MNRFSQSSDFFEKLNLCVDDVAASKQGQCYMVSSVQLSSYGYFLEADSGVWSCWMPKKKKMCMINITIFFADFHAQNIV